MGADSALHVQQRQNGSLEALKHNCARFEKPPHPPLSIPAAHFTALSELAPAVDQSPLHAQLPRHSYHLHAVQRAGTWSDQFSFTGRSEFAEQGGAEAPPGLLDMPGGHAPQFLRLRIVYILDHYILELFWLPVPCKAEFPKST